MRKTAAVLVTLLLVVQLHALPAEAGVAGDSLDVKIGQMLMIGFRGLSVNDAPDLVADIRERRIGGVVLFDYDLLLRSGRRNISDPEQLRGLTSGLMELSEIPLLVAIDQEGGRVSRLKSSKGFPSSVSAARLGSLDSPDSTVAAARRTAITLKSLHIRMNFAPVVDLNLNPDNPVIGKAERSFSADPAVVSRHALLTAKTFAEEGVVATLKHFPGHGSSSGDTHKGFTDITGSWTERELEPYRSIIGSGYDDVVMTAHVFNAKLDNRYPATLSRKTLEGVLRKELGFRGVIVSDDMQMKAITDHYGLEEAIRLAVDAGVDILLFGNNISYDPGIAGKASAILHRLVEEGAIPKQRIDRSYRRIMALKERYLYLCK